MNQNFGPFELMPAGPWSRLPAAGKSGIKQPPANFSVADTVTVQSKFSANPGVLSSGRRPERPGKS